MGHWRILNGITGELGAAALRPLNVSLTWQLYRKSGIGLPNPDFLGRLTQFISWAAVMNQTEILRSKEQHFIRLVKRICPLSKDTIDFLQQMSTWPLGFVTSSPQAEAAAILEGAGVTWHFRTVVCLDDVRSPKPDPEPYVMAMKRLRVEKGMAFEDSESGIASARAAGLEVVSVCSPRDLPALVRSRLSIRL
jgi:HAD superfamily hydrolase (TIGR01509 family)